jgi:anti-sigma B factor antagonist
VKVNQKEISDICLLTIEGEIDAEHAAQFKRALIKARENSAKKFVLDFHQVSFVDSTGLGILISLQRQLKEDGCRLRLAAFQDEVRSIFEITRLYRVFDISKTVEEALKEIRG